MPQIPHSEPNRPRILLAALAIASLEAVAVAAFGLWNLVATIIAANQAKEYGFLPMGIAFLVISLLFAAFIFWGVRNLWRGRRNGRAPVITWQLMQIVVSVSLFNVYPKAATIGLIAISTFVIAGIVNRASIAATSITGPNQLLGE